MAGQMKSPYIECFFDIMSRRDSEGKVTGLSKYFHKLNIFDQITILMRYYSLEEALVELKKLIAAGVLSGNLEVLPLIGLNSDLVFPLVQYFVDNTGDLQTAAYVSAYAVNVQQLTGKVPNRAENRLSKFINAYRQYLNSLQMWNVRAVFDIKLGEIVQANSNTYEDKPADKDARLKVNTKTDSNVEALKLWNLPVLYKTAGDPADKPQGAGAGFRGKESKELQKQYQDMNSFDIYNKRPFSYSARCYFCSKSFSLQSQVSELRSKEQPSAGMAGKRGQAANDPEKQKPVIHSCGCNKPVPSCAVCLKPMDMLNPFLELKRQQNN